MEKATESLVVWLLMLIRMLKLHNNTSMCYECPPGTTCCLRDATSNQRLDCVTSFSDRTSRLSWALLLPQRRLYFSFVYLSVSRITQKVVNIFRWSFLRMAPHVIGSSWWKKRESLPTWERVRALCFCCQYRDGALSTVSIRFDTAVPALNRQPDRRTDGIGKTISRSASIAYDER